ncbi:SpoIIE family protein phosphatase [Desulfitobacterium metallireducens]|uniref:Diguanylate cyclase n=1 Tax=Desulfitobacterium metallireducens DSM 15288 TaxID=871968 RepID=W0EA72_9FIRM|nr:PP2C family protein-serine/threonine phosphatase [Desulfitobacterium metallireducens]AHF06428.1 diguanylate cyclase [Desulfitobacterium metallireducens DSM 15288]
MKIESQQKLVDLCFETGYCSDAVIAVASRVFEAAQEGILMTNPHGRIEFVNPAFTQTTGYTLEEVLGKSPRILKSGRHTVDFYREMWLDLSEKRQWQGEIWNKRKNGEIYPETLAIHAVYDEKSELTHYFAIFTDITADMKRRKELELGGQIQKNILRPDLIHERLRMKSLFLPYDYLSGDSYDYRWDEENQIFKGFLFDVMGHGIVTALQVSALRAIFRYVVSKDLSLSEKMQWLNHESIAILPEEFFAGAILFNIDLLKETLTYSVAGINHFLIASREQGIRKVSQPGLFLGISAEEQYEECQCSFKPGDGAVFLTDGFMDPIQEKDISLENMDITNLMEVLSSMLFRENILDDATALGFIFQK